MYPIAICGDKTAEKEKTMEILNKLNAQYEDLGEEGKKYIALEINKKLFYVRVDDILYCEWRGRRHYFTLVDGTQFFVYMYRAVLEEVFRPYGEMVRLGNWYTLNLEHVEMVGGQAVKMDSGFKLNLPMTTYLKLEQQCMDYLHYIPQGVSSYRNCGKDAKPEE